MLPANNLAASLLAERSFAPTFCSVGRICEAKLAKRSTSGKGLGATVDRLIRETLILLPGKGGIYGWLTPTRPVHGNRAARVRSARQFGARAKQCAARSRKQSAYV